MIKQDLSECNQLERSADFEPDGYFYHAIATNLKVDAEEVIKIHNESIPDVCRAVWQYNERAEMENLIKDLGWGRCSLESLRQMQCISALVY